MKNLINLLFLFSSCYLSAQVKDLLTFKVTNYSINGQNFDQVALDQNLSLSFYYCDDGQLCFTNHFRNPDSQSYGGVYGLKKKHFEETTESYAIDEFQFTWNFFNTYDSNSGEAAVTMNYIYIGNTVKMVAEVLVLKTNELLIFEGYFEK